MSTHAEALAELRAHRADGVEGPELRAAVQAVGIAACADAEAARERTDPPPRVRWRKPEVVDAAFDEDRAALADPAALLLIGNLDAVEAAVAVCDSPELLRAALALAQRKGAREAIEARLEELADATA